MNEKTGLMLVNLGSPDAPTPSAVRKYLFEFLHDKRVIETTRWLWCPILHGVILRVRPRRSAAAYRKIWESFDGGEGKEAPLVRLTRQQGEGVAKLLGDDVHVEIAMRYGNPSVKSAFTKMMDMGISKIAVLPLYPQYSAATNGSVYDAVMKAIKKSRDVPDLRFLRGYHRDQGYIAALKNSISEHLENLDWEPDVILASFHGMPQSYIDKGDPYAKECLETVDSLRKALNLSEAKLQLTFQSRFGPQQWLQPYTDKVLESLPEQGKKSVAVVTPGFSADCLETLEEINMEARESFLEAGGENFTFIPCLNTRTDHIQALTDVARNQLLSGWL